MNRLRATGPAVTTPIVLTTSAVASPAGACIRGLSAAPAEPIAATPPYEPILTAASRKKSP